MKTLKLFNSCLLVLAGLLLVTAVIAFVNNHINYGICNILWMGCEILFFLINKKSIEIKQEILAVFEFISAVDNTIEKYGSAIITKNEDGIWEIKEYLPTQHKEPSCSAENNDGIEFVHNSEGGEK